MLKFVGVGFFFMKFSWSLLQFVGVCWSFLEFVGGRHWKLGKVTKVGKHWKRLATVGSNWKN